MESLQLQCQALLFMKFSMKLILASSLNFNTFQTNHDKVLIISITELHFKSYICSNKFISPTSIFQNSGPMKTLKKKDIEPFPISPERDQ